MKESQAFKTEIALAIKKLFAGEEKEVVLKHPFNGISVTRDIPEVRHEKKQASDYGDLNGSFYLAYRNILG
ncbi:MAG: hypothetical protein PHG95_01895 [Patescibacteria group bacterium]|nr:hypothetical protein [Patescibacteria group bacterium]